MTQVKLDRAVAEDLITSKMRTLQEYINSILKRWNETSTSLFLEKAHSGEYKNAEEDAVELRQFLLDYSKFQELLTEQKEEIGNIKNRNSAILSNYLVNRKAKLAEYNVFDEKLWSKITEFIKTILNHLWNDMLDIPPNPDIFIDPDDGSFSIYWETDIFKLGIEIAPNKNEAVHIYGKRIKPPTKEFEVRIPYEIAHKLIIKWLKLVLNVRGI